MRYQFIAVLLIASMCGAQTPIPVSPAAANSPAPPATTPLPRTVTVAQGTTVALTLVSSIKSKSTKPGDAVRAVVAFPVTVGAQLAIPAGTYVEGVVNAVTPRAKDTHMPSVRIQFSRLLFANGYSVALDAVNSEALVILPATRLQPTCEIADLSGTSFQPAYEIADARAGAPFLGPGFGVLGEGFGGDGQTSPPVLPPLPQIGPSKGVIVGIAVGSAAGVLVLSLALAHRHGNADYMLFDNGWQFQMVLERPLTLDAGKVAAAAGTPAAR